MVICLVAFATFSFLGIFSVRYRELAKESLKCVFRMVTLRKCETKLDQRIKAKLTVKLIKKSPRLARFVYKNFALLSWLFTIIFFASLIYSVYSVYNLLVIGRCSPEVCVLVQNGVCNG